MSDEYNFTAYMYDFEIRVGKDEDNLGNLICFKQFDPMATGTQRFPCSQALFGDWVSISKSAYIGFANLILGEICVFSGK